MPNLRSAAAIMDDKTLNLWRQIEGARRVGKRSALARFRPAPPLARRDRMLV